MAQQQQHQEQQEHQKQLLSEEQEEELQQAQQHEDFKQLFLSEYELLTGGEKGDHLPIGALVNSVLFKTNAYLNGISQDVYDALAAAPAELLPSVDPSKCGRASYVFQCQKRLHAAGKIATLSLPSQIVKASHAQSSSSKADANTWQNWTGSQGTKAQVKKASTLLDLRKFVKEAKKVRVAGRGFSWSPIVATQEDNEDTTVIEIANMNGVLSDPAEVIRTKTITVEAGASGDSIDKWLKANKTNLTFPSDGIPRLTFIGGTTSTLTHGCGYEWSNISEYVKAVSILNGQGELTTYTDGPASDIALPNYPEYNIQTIDSATFSYYKATLGMLGVIYAVTMSLKDNEIIHVQELRKPVGLLLNPAKLKEFVDKYDGWVQFLWVPNAPDMRVRTYKRYTGDKKPQPDDDLEADFPPYINKYYGDRQAKQIKAGPNPGPFFILDELIYLSLINTVTIEHSLFPKNNQYRNWYRSLHYLPIDPTGLPVLEAEFAFPMVATHENAYSVVSNAFRVAKDYIDKNIKVGIIPIDIVIDLRFTGGSNVALATTPASVCNRWAHLGYMGYDVYGKGFLEERWVNMSREVSSKWVQMGGSPHWGKEWEYIPDYEGFMKSKPYVQNFANFRRKVDPDGKFLNAKLAKIFQ